MIKILMHGCNGKMGQVITRIVKDHSDLQIVAGIDPNLSPLSDFPVFSRPEECTVDADVIIDFSTATAVRPLLEYSVLKNIPTIVCTTGLPEDLVAFLTETSRVIPVFFSANMSLGVNLIISLAKRATELLADSGFDIEIIEKHHSQKIDAPSGTALSIANAINESLDGAYNFRYDRSTKREKRPKKEIGIHAVRGGTIVGEHEIIFAGNDENISLTHTATSKEVFAVGALKAARFLANKAPGLYSMEHLLEA